MSIEVSIKKTDIENTILETGAEWVQGFLNGLGGDYSIIKSDAKFIVMQNKTACPGLCLNVKKRSTCNELEKVINQSVGFYSCQLSAGFTKCSHDGSLGCELVVSLHP